MPNSALLEPSTPAARGATTGFAALLRERTSGVHREAERSGFTADLIRGRATRDGYALFLRNLLPVYEALEETMDRAAESRHGGWFAPFADPNLRRRDPLRADLATIAGPSWEADLPTLPAAADYAAAIRTAAVDDRLVAHAYARYLGDLSGGQILKPVLGRTLGLPPETLTFYDFPALPDLDRAKSALREALDRLDPSGPAAQAIVEEAIASFRHNIAVSLAVQTAAA